jgi:putative ABC transport system permease protein
VGALFGAANTMFAAVSGRTREITTLLVLGFSPWAVMTSFITESALIALAGGVLGCLIALPINGITTSTTNFQSFSEVAFRFRVTPPLMISALVFSAALGVAGGFVPALRASRQSLAAGLRRT